MAFGRQRCSSVDVAPIEFDAPVTPVGCHFDSSPKRFRPAAHAFLPRSSKISTTFVELGLGSARNSFRSYWGILNFLESVL